MLLLRFILFQYSKGDFFPYRPILAGLKKVNPGLVWLGSLKGSKMHEVVCLLGPFAGFNFIIHG